MSCFTRHGNSLRLSEITLTTETTSSGCKTSNRELKEHVFKETIQLHALVLRHLITIGGRGRRVRRKGEKRRQQGGGGGVGVEKEQGGKERATGKEE